MDFRFRGEKPFNSGKAQRKLFDFLEVVHVRLDALRFAPLRVKPYIPLMLTVCGSCQGILDSCLGQQLPVRKDVFFMQRDVLLGGLEQLGNFQLAQPDGFRLHVQVKTGLSVVAGIQNQAAHALAPA
jgi:hypothetical protein